MRRIEFDRDAAGLPPRSGGGALGIVLAAIRHLPLLLCRLRQYTSDIFLRSMRRNPSAASADQSDPDRDRGGVSIIHCRGFCCRQYLRR
jgi:hypothetical protein